LEKLQLDLLDFAQLMDEEGDPFTVVFSGTSTDFLTADIGADGAIQVSLDDSKIRENGNFTLGIRVVETNATTGSTTSVKTYTVTFEVKDLVFDDAAKYTVTLAEPEVAKEEKPAPTMTIDKLNKFGRLEIAFSEYFIRPDNITMINSTVLEIEMTALNEDFQGLMTFTWQAVSYDRKKLSILLTFKYPLQISQDLEGKDLISVKLINPTMFMSEA